MLIMKGDVGNMGRAKLDCLASMPSKNAVKLDDVIM